MSCVCIGSSWRIRKQPCLPPDHKRSDRVFGEYVADAEFAITISQALYLPKTQQLSSMPVFGKNIDDIIGKVFKRDLFLLERQGKGDELLKKHVKPITRVAEKLPVQQLIDLFIKQRVHLFLVKDEFGQTAGIVTLEDAIETLLGRNRSF